MKKETILLSFILLLMCAKVSAQLPGLHDRSKAGIISYLNQIISNDQIIIGQHCENGANTTNGYNTYVEGLKNATGKYPGIIGLEYGFTANNNLGLINSYALKQWSRGGLVTISWHVHNPFADGYDPRANSVALKGVIDFTKLLENAPDSKEKDSYRTELTKVGKSLQQLKRAGVTVLWRPFHEMNGNWFWWGANDIKNPTNQQNYVLLWKDMYNYFTKELGLDNLIWIYSPNASSPFVTPITTQYPGSNYVDVVGVDIYSKTVALKDYDQLKQFNKPIVVAEFGPSKDSYGQIDENEVVNAFKGKAAYFLQWNGWTGTKMGLIDNIGVKKMVQNRSALTTN